jgi:hypothetical protein
LQLNESRKPEAEELSGNLHIYRGKLGMLGMKIASTADTVSYVLNERSAITSAGG